MPRPPADILRYQQIVDQHKPLPQYYPVVPEINPKTWDISNSLAHQMSQPQNILYPGQPVEMPQMQMHKNYGSGYQWDYQPLYEQKEPYAPVNTIHEQRMNPYERT